MSRTREDQATPTGHEPNSTLPAVSRAIRKDRLNPAESNPAGSDEFQHVDSNQGEAYHGGINTLELQRYGVNIEQAIDFSSNILPHGPSPKVVEAARQANLAVYPDRDCLVLRKAIASRYRIDASRVLVGNGSCELIHLVARTLICAGDPVLVVGPTFSEYERASQLAGAIVSQSTAIATESFVVPVDRIDSHLRTVSFKVVWLCNPNNPTGQSLSEQQIVCWLRQFPETTFVVDESYIEFAQVAKSLLGFRAANLVILRSLTKSYGMAGLRLGFAEVFEDMYLRLCRQRVPWTVNSPAQAAGLAALLDEEFYSRALAETQTAKVELLNELASLGFQPLASDANFFLLPVVGIHRLRLRLRLLAEGIVVRDCTSFGLPDFVRIAVLDPINNQQLVRALARIIGQPPN